MTTKTFFQTIKRFPKQIVNDHYKELLDSCLGSAEWGMRATNVLQNEGIHTWRQLVNADGVKLYRARNAGPATLYEMIRECVKIGLAPKWVNRVAKDMRVPISSCPADGMVAIADYGRNDVGSLIIAKAHLDNGRVPHCVTHDDFGGYTLWRDASGMKDVPEDAEDVK